MSAPGTPAPRPRRGGQSLLAAVVAVPVLAAAVGVGIVAQTALDGPGGEHRHAGTTVAVERDAARPVAAVAVASEHETVQDGVRALLSVRPSPDDPGTADVQLRLRDAATGAPVAPPSRPMAWADLRGTPAAEAGAAPAARCSDRVRTYRQGGLGSAAEIDLNAYDILTLNGDGTVSVIDPMADVGGMTQLRAMVTLGSPGEDWVASDDERRLFVTLPEVGEVAVVDLDAFELTHRIDVGGRPVRAALDPGGRRLWVTDDSTGGGGVTVVDARTLEVVHSLDTGAGPHTLAFAGPADGWDAPAGAGAHTHDDGHDDAHDDGTHAATPVGTPARALVGNGSDGTVSVVDPSTLELVATVRLGAPVTDLATTTAGGKGGMGEVYAAGGPGAGVSVVDPVRAQVVSRLDALEGTTALRFSPDGRWGFAVASASDRLAVLDVRTGRVVQTADDVGRAPDRVVFTHGYAYVHSAGTPEVAVVDLARVGTGATLPLVEVSGGQRPPSAGGGTAAADPVFPLHGTEALFANPADRYVYSYMEGMNAPMGGHQSYGPAPRAVRVVDRSLRQVAPGDYVAQVRLARPGDYELALLVDSPRVLACWGFSAQAPPSTVSAAPVGVRLSAAPAPVTAVSGVPTTFRFALSQDTPDGGPVVADDVLVLATEAAGTAGDRAPARSLGGGRYEVDLLLARAGTYSVRVLVPSLDVGVDDLPATAVRASEPQA